MASATTPPTSPRPAAARLDPAPFAAWLRGRLERTMVGGLAAELGVDQRRLWQFLHRPPAWIRRSTVEDALDRVDVGLWEVYPQLPEFVAPELEATVITAWCARCRDHVVPLDDGTCPWCDTQTGGAEARAAPSPRRRARTGAVCPGCDETKVPEARTCWTCYQAAGGHRGRKHRKGGGLRHITEELLAEARARYLEGASLRAVAREVFGRTTYASAASCAEGLRSAFAARDWPLRSHGPATAAANAERAFRSRCRHVHGLAPRKGKRCARRAHRETDYCWHHEPARMRAELERLHARDRAASREPPSAECRMTARELPDDWAVLCGDAADVLASLTPGSVDSIVTSPPYVDQRRYDGTGARVTERANRNGRRPGTKYQSRRQRSEAPMRFARDFERFLDPMLACLTHTGSLMLNLGVVMRDGEESPYADVILASARAAGFKLLHRLVWHKPNANTLSDARYLAIAHEWVFWLAKDTRAYRGYDRDTRAAHKPQSLRRGAGYYRLHEAAEVEDARSGHGAGWRPHPDGARPTTVFTCGVGGVRGVKHPAVMPLRVALQLVSLSSPPGGLVLDPFCGSGTTGIACRRRGRRFLGVDDVPEYAAEARRRIAGDHPGDAAVPTPGQLTLSELLEEARR